MDEAYKLKNTSWSLFGTVDFEITDRLTFTAGANYTQDRKRFSTDVVGTDIFSAVDLDAAAYTLFRRDLLLGAGVDPLTAAYLAANPTRSEEHTSELQSLMRISYAGPCLKKKHYKYNTESTH